MTSQTRARRAISRGCNDISEHVKSKDSFIPVGALTQLGSLCRFYFLHILDVCKMRHCFAEHFPGRLFKSSFNQLLNSHDSEVSNIASNDITSKGE